jgi:lipid II isoglutaminyl synthase (glutamine-hydrolysing)
LQRTYGFDMLFSESEDGLANSNGKVNDNGAALPEAKSFDASAILTPLDDRLEWESHATMLERMGLQKAAVSALRNYETKYIIQRRGLSQ